MDTLLKILLENHKNIVIILPFYFYRLKLQSQIKLEVKREQMLVLESDHLLHMSVSHLDNSLLQNKS